MSVAPHCITVMLKVGAPTTEVSNNMSNCSCHQNQTPKNVFQYVNSKGIDIESNKVLGVGVFFIPAPELGILEYKTVLVEGLTYNETIKRGHNCFAFQWAPFGFPVGEGEVSVMLARAQDIVVLGCSSTSCSGSSCPMGCYCNSGDTGNCKKSTSYQVYNADGSMLS